MWDNYTRQKIWIDAHRTGERFVPYYPVKPCPECGKEPVFIRVIGEGKWGKLTWMAVDYCGTHSSDDAKNVGSAISAWDNMVRSLPAKVVESAPPVPDYYDEGFITMIGGFFKKLWYGNSAK